MLRRLVWALLVLLAPGFALASPSTLEGGVLIAHHPSGLLYSSGEDLCARYSAEFAVGSCSAQNNRIDLDGNEGESSVWYVLAAWDEEKQFCGAEFGFAEYDSTIYLFDQWGPCFPSDGLEIPMVGWPGPNRGTAVTTQDALWSGNFVPIYWFSGYAYEEGEIPLAGNPFSEFGGTANCATPPVASPAMSFGGMGLFQDGTYACPEGLAGNGGFNGDGGMQPDGAEGYGGYETDGGGTGTPETAADLMFVEMTTTSDSTFAIEARALRDEYGLQILVGMSPDGLVCRANQAQMEGLSADVRVNLVTDEVIPGLPGVATGDIEPGDPGLSARVWNAMLEADAPDSSGGRGFAPGDSCMYFGDADGRRPLPSLPTEQTSIYMLGDIGVSVLYMESEQSGPCEAPDYPEDWTTGERGMAYDLISQGLADLAGIEQGGRVRFWLSEVRVCSTNVEPIQLNHGDSTWVNDAMNQLGFTQGSRWQKMRALCNARRAQSQTPYDWWFIVFVIADDCDSDHRFADHWISFGSISGPRATLLYLNGSGETYQLDDLDLIAIHETCHVFGAPDEYTFTGNCTEPWGYLRVPNGNDTTCVAPEEQHPCIMENNATFALCPFTRAHIGWRDSDDPPDHVYDPIDHPRSDRSMLVGDGDSLHLGDWVDIYDSTGTWTKRLVASDWSSDRGRLLWDGIGYDGEPDSTGAYSWRRNGGTEHGDSLRTDIEAPVVSDLMIMPGPDGLAQDTLSFRFEDVDTRSGRVRIAASREIGGPQEVPIAEGEFHRDTQGSPSPIVKTYTLPHIGLWTMSLLVWDVGAGHEAGQDSTYWHGGLSGIGDRRIYVPELALSRGRPNPSVDWVAWDIQLPSASTMDLAIIGVDGRCVRSWAKRTLPGGLTRILWDGCDGSGARVASGRYYLVATNRSGEARKMPATIVR